ncbi:MAG: DUF885 domain-containing protein [Taibaiella sp.]|nr:DUF885 domain-containing protein [Taibaiella sp.]MBX9449693.1 DUF885 domain-containing protein [Taibaiella sp.]
MRQYDSDRLSPSARIDHHLIENYLQSVIWKAETKKDEEWDASLYNVTGLIAFMLSEQYAPLEERLTAIMSRIDRVPEYYEVGRLNLNNAVPELIELSIQQNEGGLSVLTKDLADSIHKSGLPDSVRSVFREKNKEAIAAIQDFTGNLKAVLPESKRSFRLGKELYEQQFSYDIQSDLTAEQLYREALKRKAYLHQEMAKISRTLWPEYFGSADMPADSLVLVKMMIDTLSVNHVKPGEFQSAIEKQLPELTKFVNEKNLLYLDPSKPLVVRKEPAYMAGVAGASISAPGPYDTSGNTYYNVGSLASWPKDKAESYLREYNHYILQILNIHEAIPGHYTQLVYANKSGSLIKSVLANGAMIEGWAVYTEQMMLENGYGNEEPEMWLMWYKWNLRTVCNTILDYAVHVSGMSEEDAMELLIHQAFQQEAEASGKWRRVNVTSVQLTSYFSGYTEIIRLREEWKKKQGDKFDLKEFHEQFLSYGNAPVKYIKEMMMR